MGNFTKNNKIYGYILVLIALFIIVLVTRNQVSNIQIKKDEINVNQSNESSLRNDLTRLNDIRNKISNEENDIDKYIVNISEDEIIDYIYSKIENDNLTLGGGIVDIRNITMNEGDVNEMGFKELSINLSLRVPSEDRMIKFLDFLTGDESKYKFYITSFNYPNVNKDSIFNVNIPLKIFYK